MVFGSLHNDGAGGHVWGASTDAVNHRNDRRESSADGDTRRFRAGTFDNSRAIEIDGFYGAVTWPADLAMAHASRNLPLLGSAPDKPTLDCVA